MTELELLSAGLIAAAMLATSVMAQKRHLNARQVAKNTPMPARPARPLAIT
jgi:hypothetical protein